MSIGLDGNQIESSPQHHGIPWREGNGLQGPQTTDETPEIGSRTQKQLPATRRRHLRWLLWLTGSMLFLAGLGFFLVTRSFVLEAIARPHIEATVGGDIDIGYVRWLSFSELEVHDLTVHAPGWTGPASEVIRIDKAIIELDATKLQSGSFEVDRFIVDGMLVRLAERSSEPGSFNILALQPGVGGGGEPPDRIDINNLEFQMGVEQQGNWERSGSVKLEGELVADPNQAREFVIQFITQPDEDGNQSVLKGEIDTSTLAFNASIDDLAVNSTLLGMMPLELRRVAESMELSGHVNRIETAWDGENDIYAAIDLGESILKLPELEDDNTWSRLDAGVVTPARETPTIALQSGRIALSDDRLTLEDFDGQLRSTGGDSDTIPVRIEFQMDLAPILAEDLDWTEGISIAEHAFRVAPFSLEFTIPDFKIRANSEGVVLPRAVARTLSEFGVESWIMNINANLARGLPTTNDDGSLQPAELHTTGTVIVANGVGRYSRFPYPLENVRAFIEFDDVSVTINYLIGTGANGGTVTVNGIIIEPGPAAEIDVRVLGEKVPADRLFRSALDGWRRRTWDRFFDEHAQRQLREAGVLSTQETVETAKKERMRVLKLLAEVPAGNEEERMRLRKESDRLQRVIEAGPFELGGLFGFDLRVTSAAGENSPVFLTGEISILEGHVLLSDFPFPIYLLPSTIRLDPADIVLGEGVSFITPNGGTGVIRGSIHNPDSEDDQSPTMVPNISFAAIDVAVTPALLASLPPGDGDEPIDPGAWPGRWQSEAARAMGALGLQGNLDLEGWWRGDMEQPSLDPRLEFDATLIDGSITPNKELFDFFAEAGIIWPEGFQLEDCNAKIHLEPARVEMTYFEGHRRGGIVNANGFVSRESDQKGLEVEFRSIQLEEYLLDLVPEGPQTKARELWTRFNPRGTFDADLDWSQDPDGTRHSLVNAQPHVIILNMDGTDVAVLREQGDIKIRGDEIELNNLLLRLSTPRLTHGIVAIDGAYGKPKGNSELQLEGTVEEGQFESPVLPVLLDLFGADRLYATWLELDPSGRFNSRFEYRGLQNEATDYAIDIVPTNISANIGEDRLHAVFDDGSVFIGPDRVDMEQLVARIPAPGTIQVNGTVSLGEKIELLATAEYDLRALPQGFDSYLPVPLNMAFEAVDFAADGPVRLSNCGISGTWDAMASIDQPDLYQFDGRLDFEDAKFTAGAGFDLFDGHTEIHLDVNQDDDGKLIAHLDGTLEGDHVDVQERRITNPYANLTMRDDNVFHLSDVSGNIADGLIVGEIAIDQDDRSWQLELDLEDASLQELSHGRDMPKADGTIGRVLANMRLFGEIDEPESKRGRGRLVIVDGQMTNSPLTLSIVHLSQLMIPGSDSLEFAEIAFTIDGNRMLFDEFLLSSPTIQFVGTGEMSVSDWELALRLSPRGTIPILSDLIGGFTGTLYAINVGGTLGDPKASIEPLPLLGGRATIEDSDDEDEASSPVEPENEQLQELK